MDQHKIGSYIADKRKSLDMTQAQLAEKLGVSNKSVSKWERGVNLPDVSLYENLCNTLGITINEFLAGEDLEPTEALLQADRNIVDVTRDGKIERNTLRKIIAVLVRRYERRLQGVLRIHIFSIIVWLNSMGLFYCRRIGGNFDK